MVVVTAGVGAVLPLFVVIVEEDIYNQYPFLQAALDYFGRPEKSTILLSVVSAFFLLISIKVLVAMWILVKQKRLSTSIRVSVTDRLFRHLVSQPYSFHLAENSAKVLRNLTADISGHGRCLESVIIIFSEILIIVALVVVLVVVDPFGVSVIAVLVGISAGIYFRIIQPKLGLWGDSYREESALMVQHTQQALGGIKEIKVLNREEFFERLFAKTVKRMTSFERKFSVIQAVPANGLEVLTALSIFVLVAGANIRNIDVAQLIPILILFVASAVRLAPSMARIAGAYQTIRYNRPGMKALYQRLVQGLNHIGKDGPSVQFTHAIDDWSVLRISNLNFSYDHRRQFSLSDINLNIKKGSALGIVGESGSGKSTLLDIVLGLNEAYTGVIEIDGADLRKVRREWQAQIGYVPQSVYLIDDSLRQNIALGVPQGEIDNAKLQSAIERAQLSSFVDSLESGLDSVVGERGARISGGQQQRVGIARALYRDPSVLILDEATSALDSRTEQEFMRTVSSMHGSVTMIIIAHRVSTLRGCDNLIRLRDGKVIQEGPFEELISEA